MLNGQGISGKFQFFKFRIRDFMLNDWADLLIN